MPDRKTLSDVELDSFLEPLKELKDCYVCPRECHANRFGNKLGYCHAGPGFYISSVCIHRGEEPPISGSDGVCNVFFTNCNLQCNYCQNHQISMNSLDHSKEQLSPREVVNQITAILDRGINSVGFVSPSHFIPQMKVIINIIRELGYDPVFIYNTNAYDKVTEIRKLENYIDVYLPDFKYIDTELAKSCSDVHNYPENALNAIKEMYRQVGSELIINSKGYLQRGMIVRHLVIPGAVANSVDVLRTIASRISPQLSISLMSQYYPNYRVASHEHLGRTLRKSEYNEVVKEMESLGMSNGWIQDMASYDNYRPDFSNKTHPFE